MNATDDAYAEATLDRLLAEAKAAEAAQNETPDTEPERDPNALYNMQGNKLGRRGLIMRSDLMNALLAELRRGTPLHKVKVVDIARRVRTSPATFWQYFADVEECLNTCLEDVLARIRAQKPPYDLYEEDMGLAVSDALFELLLTSSLLRAAVSCTNVKTVGLVEDVLLELSGPLTWLAGHEDQPLEISLIMRALLSLALVSDFTEDHVFEDLEDKVVALTIQTIAALRAESQN